jgi:uncharacterized protein YcfJ
MRYALVLLLLAGCATPETVLIGPKGEIISCGGSSVGSLTGGMIGYHIQKSLDESCVNEHLAKKYHTID